MTIRDPTDRDEQRGVKNKDAWFLLRLQPAKAGEIVRDFAMLCYHGTSADNLDSILREGLKCGADKIWNCSLQEIYFWGQRIVELEGHDDPCDNERMLLQQALDSSIFSLALAKDCRPVIVVFEIDDHEEGDDLSCDHMECSSTVSRDIRPEEIKKILVGPDLGLFRGFFIGTMLNRNEMNSRSGIQVMHELSDMEIRIGELMHGADFYPFEDFCTEDFDVITPDSQRAAACCCPGVACPAHGLPAGSSSAGY